MKDTWLMSFNIRYRRNPKGGTHAGKKLRWFMVDVQAETRDAALMIAGYYLFTEAPTAEIIAVHDSHKFKIKLP